MYNRKYDKVYLILRPENDAVRAMGGNCTIEIKNGRGKAALYAQGLRPLTGGAVYRVYMISVGKDEATGVLAGGLQVDEKGQTELRWSFDADDVSGSGKSLEEFHAVAILIEEDGKKSSAVTAPLCGYVFEPKEWKSKFVRYGEERAAKLSFEPEIKPIESKQEKKVEVSAIAPEPVESETQASAQVVAQEPEEAGTTEEQPVMEAAETAAVPLPGQDFRKMLQRFRHELDSLKEDGILTPEQIATVQEVPTEDTAKEEEWSAPIVSTPEKEVVSVPDKGASPLSWNEAFLLQNNPQLNPFVKCADERWVRVSPRETAVLPMNAVLFSNHPFLTSSYKKYRHFILGQCDGALMLGVPDVYSEYYRNKAENLGFDTFRCCEGGEPRQGKYGYWMMELK